MFRNHCFKPLPLLFLFFLSLFEFCFLSGCGGGPSFKKEIVNFHPLYEKEFSKRSSPARISSSSGDSLKQSGHFVMGTMAVEHTDRVCWEDSSCKTNTHNRTSTAVLAQEAGKKGGDLVILNKNNQQNVRNIQKYGACIRSENKCTQVWVSDYRQECSGMGSSYSCRSVAAGGHSETTCIDECKQWAVIPGKLHYTVSIGTIWRHDPEMVSEIEALAKANRTKDIFKTIQGGDVKRFKELLAIESRQPVSKEKEALLIAAVKNQQYEIYTLLKPTKKDVNTKGTDDLTALHYAVEQRNPKMAEMLLKNGADINARDSSGNTPLHRAISKGKDNIQTIFLLLQTGADVNAPDKYQYTPLHFATMYRDTPVVQLLLKRGADVNKTNFKGDTALHKAVRKLDLKGIQLLLDHGAAVNAKNRKGLTPLKEANKRTQDKKKVVELLKKYGAQ